jgi:hypothetical protein
MAIDASWHRRGPREFPGHMAQPLSRVGDFTMIAEDKHR